VEDFLRLPSSGYSSWRFLDGNKKASTMKEEEEAAGDDVDKKDANTEEYADKEEEVDDSEHDSEEADLRVTTSTHSALAVDPRTGREVFFNQVTYVCAWVMLVLICLDEMHDYPLPSPHHHHHHQIIAAFTGWSDVRNDPESSVTLASDSSSSSTTASTSGRSENSLLDREAMLDIARFMQVCCGCCCHSAISLCCVLNPHLPFNPPPVIPRLVGRHGGWRCRGRKAT
jgi:hypothetical protein